MSATATTRNRIEFGDFQTPNELAALSCRVLAERGIRPLSVVEPTCGVGNFLLAAAEQFTHAQWISGFDINEGYVSDLRANPRLDSVRDHTTLRVADFFETDWNRVFLESPQPILVVGNPPWVTNSVLGSFESENLPQKVNIHKAKGISALTGKSNFDISEWMLMRLVEVLASRRATIALLVKTSVARKVLTWILSKRFPLIRCELHRIDSALSFDVAVDAGLFVIEFGDGILVNECTIFHILGDLSVGCRWGERSGRLVSDISAFDRWQHLRGGSERTWRSGVKHDCAKVMELTPEGSSHRNGFGERVEIEPDCVYPLLKSSDLANDRTAHPRLAMIVPQKTTGEDTADLQKRCPKTWKYLNSHAAALDKRASSIYRNRPQFSVFGIGDYTFAPWKVAISGFYKRYRFCELVPTNGKPVVLDDTSYFLPCQSQPEAQILNELLNSEPAIEFFTALTFWDSKRPITVEILQEMDIDSLASECGKLQVYRNFIPTKKRRIPRNEQRSLFMK